MSIQPPSSGDPRGVPSAPSVYAVPSSFPPGAPWSGPPVASTSPMPTRAGTSWVAWLALGLSALALVVAMSAGVVYAANSLSAGNAVEGAGALDGEVLYYDAGMPSWGSVELTDTGDVEEFTLEQSVEKYVNEGLEEFGGDAGEASEVDCEALVQPKKDSVGTCSLVVQDVDSTVVLFFLNDQGAYLATLY